MGGYMGVAAKEDCVFDLYFGIDYHSHLGTRRGGMVVYDDEKGFDRSIHNIENAPFRTKFDKDMQSYISLHMADRIKKEKRYGRIYGSSSQRGLRF